MKKIKGIFLAGCSALMLVFVSCEVPSYPNGKVTAGETSSLSQNDYSEITINNVDAALDSAYMRGIDVSEVKALEEDGVLFYDSDNSQKDVFEILSENGVNWIRLRLWNDYTKALSDEFGPYGYNNLNRTINMAQRAKAQNMKVLLDFHYSDTWADPDSQKCPEMWSAISDVDVMSQTVADWTVDVLSQMKKAGCEPDMIQLGNEMEGGIFQTNTALSHSSSSEIISNTVTILKAAAAAVRSYNGDIKIMLHASRGGNKSIIEGFLSNYVIDSDGNDIIPCDVVGLSYYPYYSSHGTISQLQNNIATIKADGKEAVIAEISYGYSTEAYTDDLSNTFWETQEALAATLLPDYAGITTRTDGTKIIAGSIENQAGVVREVIEKTAQKGGSGIFYWGGCYLGYGSTESSWENQALFDVNGKALPSLAVFGVKGK